MPNLTVSRRLVEQQLNRWRHDSFVSRVWSKCAFDGGNDIDWRKSRNDLPAMVDGRHYSSCLTHFETFPPQKRTTTLLPA
jgi:hypothetical protein